MKYVIDCTPNQLALLQELIEKDTDSEAPVCVAVKNARPLSELCEEVSKELNESGTCSYMFHPEAMKAFSEYCNNK